MRLCYTNCPFTIQISDHSLQNQLNWIHLVIFSSPVLPNQAKFANVQKFRLEAFLLHANVLLQVRGTKFKTKLTLKGLPDNLLVREQGCFLMSNFRLEVSPALLEHSWPN